MRTGATRGHETETSARLSANALSAAPRATEARSAEPTNAGRTTGFILQVVGEPQVPARTIDELADQLAAAYRRGATIKRAKARTSLTRARDFTADEQAALVDLAAARIARAA